VSAGCGLLHDFWIIKDGISVNFGGLATSREKQAVRGVLPYAKEVTCEDKMKLDEEAIEECSNVDNDVPLVLQLTDGETVHMVMRPDKGVGCKH
jgi:hypothetical protein